MSTYHIYSLASHHALSPEVESGDVTRSCLQVWTVPPLHANQGEGHPGDGEEVQGGVPNPLQLWQEVHWGDSEETRDEDEGAPGCVLEGSTGEVSPRRTCMGEPHHPIKWEEATVIDQARTNKELLLKEAIHIRLQHPHLNRDGGLELPGCWVAALKGTAARVDRRQPATSGDIA